MPFPRPKLNLEGIDKPLTLIIGGIFLNLLASDISVELQNYSFVPTRLIPYLVVCSLAIIWQIFSCRVAVQPKDASRDVQRLILMEVIERRKEGIETRKLLEEKAIELDENPAPANIEPGASESSSQAPVCPSASESSSQVVCARDSKSSSQALVSITIQTEEGNEDVRHVDAVFQANAIFKSCKVLQKRFEVGPQVGELELYRHSLQIVESVRRAGVIDKYCTLQLGLFALKDTDSGLKWWELDEDWTPKICSLSRFPWSFLDLLPGRGTKWIIKGFNLRNATLRIATANESENLKVAGQYKIESGQDKIVCEEPDLIRKSAPKFRDKLYIFASNSVEVEEGVTLTLRSEAQDVKRAYWTSVLDGLIPSPWMLILMAGLSLWGGLANVTCVADDLFSKLASLSVHFRWILHNIMDHVYFGRNTVVSSIWSDLELYNFVLVYIFALIIRDLVSALWQRLQEHVPSLGCRHPDPQILVGSGVMSTEWILDEESRIQSRIGSDAPNRTTTTSLEQMTDTPGPAPPQPLLRTDVCEQEGCDSTSPIATEITTSTPTPITAAPPTLENITDIPNPAIQESSTSGNGNTSSGSIISSDSIGTTLERTEADAGTTVTRTSDISHAALDLNGPEVRGEVPPIMANAPEASLDREKTFAVRDGSDLNEISTTAATGDSRNPLDGDRCPPHGSVAVCGRRREMEDAVAAIPAFLSVPREAMRCRCPSSHQHTGVNAPLHFFGVYDGHGGSQAALFCADRLHHALAEEMNNAFNVGSSGSTDSSRDLQWRKAMLACFLRMDAEVGGVCRRAGHCDKADGGSKCCTEPIAPETVGSTAVVAVIGSCQIIVANCGDSRAVLSRGGLAIALSNDHKPEREDEMARVEAAGGRVIFWNGYRVLGVLAMSRAIGDRYLKPYVIAEPEVTCTQRSDEDECLILASDGLWDVLSNEVVCDIARKCLAGRRCSDLLNIHVSGLDEDADESPASVAAALLTKLALARGSSDNISVVVVDLMVRGSG